MGVFMTQHRLAMLSIQGLGTDSSDKRRAPQAPYSKGLEKKSYSVNGNIVEIRGQRLTDVGRYRDYWQGVIVVVNTHLQYCPCL